MCIAVCVCCIWDSANHVAAFKSGWLRRKVRALVTGSGMSECAELRCECVSMCVCIDILAYKRTHTPMHIVYLCSTLFNTVQLVTLDTFRNESAVYNAPIRIRQRTPQLAATFDGACVCAQSLWRHLHQWLDCVSYR